MMPKDNSDLLALLGLDSGPKNSCQFPYESPIERELIRVLIKYLSEAATIENQIEIQTPNGNFRADFLVTISGRKVVLEADGREFHSYETDLVRDALILGFSDVAAIYHFRGKDIMYSLENALWAVADLDPSLFSERGIANLTQLSEVSGTRGEVSVYSDHLAGYSYNTSDDSAQGNVYDVGYMTQESDGGIARKIQDVALRNPGRKISELLPVCRDEKLLWYPD
ncbi:hypothetical protein AAFN60_18185 [Roseibacillus persicicus]|uniref:hypothetical protein n=1 Tax=Roseibacillus persicicus TaxID=454148 RepID=UPI00398AAAAE